MRKLMLSFVMLCLIQLGWTQNKNQEVDIVSHTVQMGETVRMLSKKYLVDPSEIYKLNKFAVDGIRQGMVLQIPVPRKEPVAQQEDEVAAQETPPQETVADETPKARQQKTKSVDAPVVNSRESETQHIVESGETLYSLSRKYNISVDEIKMSNEGLKGLSVGQVVRIPTTRSLGSEESSIGSTVTPKRARSEAATQAADPVASTSETITHEVAPKETLYSLSKKYGITADEIKNQNPDIAKHGLQVGQILTIRKN